MPGLGHRLLYGMVGRYQGGYCHDRLDGFAVGRLVDEEYEVCFLDCLVYGYCAGEHLSQAVGVQGQVEPLGGPMVRICPEDQVVLSVAVSFEQGPGSVVVVDHFLFDEGGPEWAFDQHAWSFGCCLIVRAASIPVFGEVWSDQYDVSGIDHRAARRLCGCG